MISMQGQGGGGVSPLPESWPSSPTSSSSSTLESDGDFDFDVFLSFRLEDGSSKAFAEDLCKALKAHGLRTCFFVDKESREELGCVEQILRAMERSGIFIPIFSKGYADCRVCLMEVAGMVELKRLMLPVFYDIEPREVRNQRGSYESAFRKHEESQDLDGKTVKKWRDALKETGEIKGYDVQNEADGKEHKLLQFIVKRVVDERSKVSLDVSKYPVGLEPVALDVIKLLNLNSRAVGMAGIYGIGGVGKTTLSKAVYNRISSKFEASCFLLDIKEVAKRRNGLVSLQEQLIREVLNDKNVSISSVDQGINLIKRRIHCKRLLIILDDVSESSHISAFAGSRDWFSPDSRIIITTRNKHILNVHGLKENEFYQLEGLDSEQSLQLFSCHAFGTAEPMDNYAVLSKEIASTTGGLPLTLEVLGSLFFDKRSIEEWEEAWERVKQDQHKDVHERLKISYDGLDEEEKQVFLDIACFFSGKGKANAIHMWRASNFFPSIALKVFLHKSLIKIDSRNDEFQMHEQIREMGMHIVLHESLPEQRSRLWKEDEILDVVEKHKGTETIECIALDYEWYSPRAYFSTEAFSAITQLRLLHVNAVEFEGQFHNFPSKLKWLQWHGCLLNSLPYELELGELAVLDLSRSGITSVWNDSFSGTMSKKVLDKLKVLDLTGCNRLKVTPNFDSVPCLEKLVLDDCCALIQVHESISHLKHLVYWSMKRCQWLKKLPDGIFKLNKLKNFALEGCVYINTLPEQLGEMKSLKELNLRGIMVQNVPDTIGLLSNLQTLDLRDCLALSVLPNSIGNAKNMRVLYLDGSGMQELPDSIGCLQNLEELKATHCHTLNSLPNSLGNARNLKRLYLEGTNIRYLPESIGLLENLEVLQASYCDRLKSLPASIAQLKSLRSLELKGTEVSELPVEIWRLENLIISADFRKLRRKPNRT